LTGLRRPISGLVLALLPIIVVNGHLLMGISMGLYHDPPFSAILNSFIFNFALCGISPVIGYASVFLNAKLAS